MVNIFVDSITAMSGNTTQYALNTVFDRQMPENGQYQIIHQPQFLQKEMWVQNDTFFFQNPAATKMILSQAQIGQTWIFDAAQNITANVVDIQVTTTFGQADSLKIIVLNTNDTLILSKEFGIIRFPFAYNSPYFYQLVGINDLHLGTTVPMFEDIFNFEVGDMFEYYIDGSNYDDILKYSISTKLYSNDTFYYNIVGLRKMIVPGSGFNYDSITEVLTYTKNTYPKLDIYNYDKYVYLRINPIDYFAITNLIDSTFLGYPTVMRQPKRYAMDCSYTGIPSNTDTLCDALIGGGPTLFSEFYRDFTVGKGLGYVYRTEISASGGWWSGYTQQLVAFRKNGITYGTFTPDSLLIAGIENSKNSSFYQVFPNPTMANITLLFNKIDNYTGEIYNVLGKNMNSFFMENNKEQIIDLQDFPAGIYYLEVVNSKGKRSIEKVIKQ